MVKLTTREEIEKATKRYADALMSDMIANNRLVKSEIEKRKTHLEVILAGQDLRALRFNY